jgi:hypothetical protein
MWFGLSDRCTGSLIVLSCVQFLCISVFCWLGFRQNHASILFRVYKKFGAFLYSLLCTAVRSIGVWSFLCLCYMYGHSCVYVICMCVFLQTTESV